ncbi:MAG: nucleotidyltransferase domain-containing protein, partial [Verrucomicrobia bacterium]|nr:nucleotidyltransferase domain-containing protein [Verrucomicrobiota bacterium]
MANLHILPKKLLEELRQLVSSFQNQGINLILFGSFAEGKGRSNSDLDLAYDGAKMDRVAICQLHEIIENLHTVRSVDLVDLQRVDAGIAAEIRTNGRLVADCL